MAKVGGVFDFFPDLDQIPLADIAQWFKPTSSQFALENYIANKLFYPQAVPISNQEMEIDLGILREALKRTPKLYIQKKIIIPEAFIARFPPLSKLVWAFIDAYQPTGVVALAIHDGQEKLIGSIIVPEFNSLKDSAELQLEDKKYNIKAGSLVIIPYTTPRSHIAFKSKEAQLLNKHDIIVEVVSGSLGLVIDGRLR